MLVTHQPVNIFSQAEETGPGIPALTISKASYLPMKEGASLSAAQSATRDITAFSMPTQGHDVRRGHCHKAQARSFYETAEQQGADAFAESSSSRTGCSEEEGSERVSGKKGQ
jgi:hypothetical protein